VPCKTTLLSLVAAWTCLVVAGCGASATDPTQMRMQVIARQAGALGGTGLSRLERGMGAGALGLAARFDPAAHTDFWDRPAAWTSLDLARPPSLPFGQLSQADAAEVNSALANDLFDLAPAKPFFLHATGPERERAILCMTQAVYYEAAFEPLEGQQAVAQTVINRMRHPYFPKSVCGVVYQGSAVPIYCQFSFTCDGSLAKTPIPAYWDRARQVAVAALSGFVAKSVGSATFYHADYVFPRWGPTMVRIVQLGAHIFYRFPGPAGEADALNGRYAGGELAVSITGPPPDAIAAARAALSSGVYASATAPLIPDPMSPPTGPPAAAGIQLLVVAAPPPRPATPGQVVAGRRIPTRDEIARINAQLSPPADDGADGPIATAHAD
jgi:spore germination cell wall hydrolase CwlJ-like protein